MSDKAPFEVGFTLDDSDFMKNFADIVDRQIPDLALKGLQQAAAMLLGDAIKEEPRAPHLTGTLWREKKIDTAKKEGDTFVVIAGFNVEYAAYMHEGFAGWDWTLAGSGPKFLESKMATNMNKYVQKIADVIRPGGGGGAGAGAEA